MTTPPPEEPPRRGRAPFPARLLGIGARSAERVAAATGIDDAVESATEEAIVRALESPAVERAIIRVLESDAAQESFERTLTSPAVERAAVKVLDSQLVDRVWDQLLDSDEVQRLIERIAEAPEVRAAITSQGVGLIEDIGRGIREVADRVDIAIAHVLERVLGTKAAPATDKVHVGLFTRAVGAFLDGLLLNLSFLAVSALFGITIGGVIGDNEDPTAAGLVLGGTLWIVSGAVYLTTFWALAGQTIGMRLLSIRLDAAGQRKIGARRAFRRLIGTVLSILSLGIGFAMIAFDPHRRSLADRFAGTEVIEADDVGPARVSAKAG